VRRGFEIAARAALDVGVAGLLDEHRQPAHLELGARRDHEIRAARPRDEARLGLDAMHVLQRRGGDVHVHLVAAQLLRERAPVWRGGQHLERGVRRHARRDDQQAMQTHE
jgi:hypothetical protein